MRLRDLIGLGVLAASLLSPGFEKAALACGGGVVTSGEGTVANAQRIVVSIHDGITDVVTQIGVPATNSDYGALLPVPSEPTLDPEPVPSNELDALVAETAPEILLESEGTDSSGCGCGSTKAASDYPPKRGGIEVGGPVTIGPVTAVVLLGTDAGAVTAWLDDNGFEIPAAHQMLVDDYSGPGRFFIAIRRSDSASTGGATSIGVHFTLPAEHGELPLPFAVLGAAPTVGFTVFVAAPRVMAAEAPFVTRNLDDLSAELLRDESYAAAVAEASTRDGGLAFVIEGVWTPPELAGKVGPKLEGILGSGSRFIARHTTILPVDSLTADAHFTMAYSGSAPRDRFVSLASDSSNAHPGPASALLVGLAFLLRRPRRRLPL